MSILINLALCTAMYVAVLRAQHYLAAYIEERKERKKGGST